MAVLPEYYDINWKVVHDRVTNKIDELVHFECKQSSFCDFFFFGLLVYYLHTRNTPSIYVRLEVDYKMILRVMQLSLTSTFLWVVQMRQRLIMHGISGVSKQFYRAILISTDSRTFRKNCSGISLFPPPSLSL